MSCMLRAVLLVGCVRELESVQLAVCKASSIHDTALHTAIVCKLLWIEHVAVSLSLSLPLFLSLLSISPLPLLLCAPPPVEGDIDKVKTLFSVCVGGCGCLCV